MDAYIYNEANAMYDELVRWRRDLHKIPELGLELPQTAAYVMDRLKDLDAVAYVRFASVYREFKDVNTFMDELKKFLN